MNYPTISPSPRLPAQTS